MRVLITGTSSGIGKAIAEKFLKEGFDVTGFDRKAASIVQEHYTHFCLDIRDKKQYPSLAPFDIVINNAGVQNEDDIDINLKGTIAITESYGIHDGIRAVLMIGSASGHTGAEFPEYTASKGGVLAYTKNVALRIAPYGGTCNSLDFGGVLTELNLPVMEDKKALGSDYGSDTAEEVDDRQGGCRLGVFHDRDEPVLHRAEYSD